MAKDILEQAPTAIQTDTTDRRIVYNGEFVSPAKETISRNNRPVKRRKRSPFTFMFILVTASIVVVFYIWNKIAVNRLAGEVNDLQNQYQKILSANEILRAEINQKSKLERIGKIATDKLGMTYPKDQPIWFELNAGQQQSSK